MRIIEINSLPNGAHNNAIGDYDCIPDGYALVPDTMSMQNFPFGDIVVEEIGGVPTVVEWTPKAIPQPDPVEEEISTEDLLMQMIVDQEARICMLEMAQEGVL